MQSILSIMSYTFATAAGACFAGGVYVLIGGGHEHGRRKR